MFGVECSSGDTFTDGSNSYSMVSRIIPLHRDTLKHLRQTSMFVPDPVISLAIKPVGQETPNFSRALNRFQKEDPTFRVHIDSESQEVHMYAWGPMNFVLTFHSADHHIRNGRASP